MTEYHPLTNAVIDLINRDNLDTAVEADLDALIREHTAPKGLVVESGVAFPDAAPGAEVQVAATLIESGNQLQQVFIGLEPVIVVQPEYDIDAHRVTLVTTTVDAPPVAMVEIFSVLLDAAQEMVRQQESGLTS